MVKWPAVPHAGQVLQQTGAALLYTQYISCRAGVTSLAALTALRNLKFDLQHCYHLTDKHLRHLARLRLTALSLPQLDKVCLGCHRLH